MAEEVKQKTRIHTVYTNSEGQRVPSVTTILGILNKPALLTWAWQCGVDGLDYRTVRDDAAGVGTLAHYLIMCDLKGEKPDTSEYSPQDVERAENCLIKYWDWEKQNKPEPVLIEQPLVSDKLNFGGTIDCLAKVNGEIWLIDYKTGKAIYPEMVYQLAAYQALLSEHSYIVNQARILRIGRDDREGFEERQFGNWEKAFELFICCKRIYELQKEIK